MMDRKSLKKLKKQQRKASQQSSGSIQSSRGRRGALSAFHFKQEKQCKQFLQYAKEGKSGELRALLEGGLEIEDIDYGIPALVCACNHGYLETVAVLLRFGAHVNTCGESESAPIHVAARKGHCGTIALLLSHGANVNLPNKSDKRTAMHLAALMGQDEVIRLLVENNAHVDQVDIYGSTPLHLAARMGHQSTVELLLRSKADVNAYDNDGWTSLHLAAESGNLSVVKLLLSHNSQVDCQNKYGRTPLHWATSNGHSHIVLELLQYKANPNISDFHKKKALHYATSLPIKKILQPLTNDDSAPKKTTASSSIGLYCQIDPRVSKQADEEEKDETLRIPTPLSVIIENHVGSRSGISSPGSSSTMSRHDGRDLDFIESPATHSSALLLHRMSEDSDTESAPKVKGLDIDKLSTISSSSSAVVHGSEVMASTPRGGTPAMSIVNSPALTASESDSDSSDSDDPDGTSDTVVKEAVKQKKKVHQAFEKIIHGFSCLKTEVQTMSRDLGRSRDSACIEVMSSALMATQTKLQKMQRNISDMQEEFRGDSQFLVASGEKILASFQTGFQKKHPLPGIFNQAVLYCSAKIISGIENGWQKVICKLVLQLGKSSEHWIQDIRARSENNLECALQAVYWACKLVTQRECTALRDLLNFLEKCELGEGVKDRTVAAVVELIQKDREECVVVGASTFYNLSTRLGDQAKELGMRLGVSRDQISTMEAEMEDSPESAQALCLGVLSLWNATDQRADKLSFLAQCLIDIGQEGLLAVILCKQR